MPKTDLLLAATYDADRYAGMKQRHAIERQLKDNAAERALRVDAPHERRWTRLLARLRPDHSLTPYLCRLSSGGMGRTAIRLVNGEWMAVCVRGAPLR
jgi:hypothetical protein